MRIPVRTSRLAIIARRMASFALPLIIIPVFLHRNKTIDSEMFSLIVAIGMGFAALGLLAGSAAVVRLWFTGDMGWWRAVTGIFIGLICLSPLAMATQLYLHYPEVSDVSTGSPPSIELRNKPQMPTRSEAERAEILGAFPNLISRDYVLAPNQAYAMALDLVKKNGWTIINGSPPELERAQGQINAIETTFLGWEDEIGVRVIGTGEGVEVSVRSASLTKTDHDLGRNGLRIEAFLQDLDAMVTDQLRKGLPAEAPPAPANR